MANLAVLASGSGSNFEALARALEPTEHECVLLISDRASSGAVARAERLGIPHRHVRYAGRPREEAEAEIDVLLKESLADLVALAGFMRLLSPEFVRRRAGRILNVHPALLPAYPGLEAIRRAWDAGETLFGATIHLVDAGMDTGPILKQGTVQRRPDESIDELEARIHVLEHTLYTETALRFLNDIDRIGGPKGTNR